MGKSLMGASVLIIVLVCFVGLLHQFAGVARDLIWILVAGGLGIIAYVRWWPYLKAVLNQEKVG